MNPDSEIRVRAEDIAAREIDGETVILDARRSLYLAINTSGTLLWRLLVDGATRDELVEGLTARFAGMDEATAERDVDAFLALLEQHDLITT